jgi:DNA-binding MarR family transcriptional regulator
LPASNYSASSRSNSIQTAADTIQTQATAETAPAADPGREATSQELPARLRAAIGKLSRRLRPTIAGSDLTPSQISILLTVDRRGPMRLTELAAIESINPTMLSRITGALCERGLITRTPDAVDRRAALVESTAAGRRMRKRILKERTSALQSRLQELSEQERQALEAALPALERLAALVGEQGS